MDRQNLSKFTKGFIILLGLISLSAALFGLPFRELDARFLLVVAFSTIVAPRMSLALPRSRFAISFSDASVFLAFLWFGGPAAIIVAALESTANCLYLRSKGFKFGQLMIPANVSINVLAFTVTYLIWLAIPETHWFTWPDGSTQYLFVKLGCVAMVQFAVASVLAAFLLFLKDGSNIWHTWRKDCFSSSMTQIVGAGLAGLVFKLVNFADMLIGVIAFFGLGLAYLSYRQSINEVKEAMNQAESAEREKAETERERRREAEKHALQLTKSLEKEEKANDALRRSEKDLQHAALFDALTDLPNRKYFGDILRELISTYRDDPSATFHVLFLDLRKFKHINDSLGHTLGDKVLKIIARRFTRALNKTDMIARLGGDEFAIILKNIATVGKAQKVARKMLDSVSQPFSISGNRITLSANIGVAPCDTEYETPEQILRDADIAMHHAKMKNSGVAVFTKEMRVQFLERVRLENDLLSAVDRGELSMHYQPLVTLRDGSLLGFEALLRWHHPELGNIPPNKFIPIAEESGLIIPITVWILQETAKQIAQWQKISRRYRDLIVSVNISGKHLSNDDLVDEVENALEIARITPGSLKLEITESAAMENADITINVLNRLKALGVQLSIDDFGTGYSSLSYLHRLPFDTLKVDRSFVSSVSESGDNSEILQTIISLAKGLKKKVIAEGIETEAQLNILQNLGCDYGQGYLLSKPQTPEVIERSLYENRGWLPSPDLVAEEKGSTIGDEALPVF